jgi:DNA-binding NtrC family response regulator
MASEVPKQSRSPPPSAVFYDQTTLCRENRGKALQMETTQVLQCPDGKKILVVEDEETIRRICGVVLDHSGFESILATNGAEGLDAYRKSQSEICLVLADVSMPVKGGIGMLRDILDIDPDAKAILMSGYCIDVIVPEDLKKRCSLLQKPFMAAVLVEAVRKCLNHDQGQMATAA